MKTTIDPAQLVVVAFVQEAANCTPPPAPSGTSTTTDIVGRIAAGTQPTSPTFKVLQAAWVAVSAPTTRRD